ncbi:hypothetical protein ABEB36_002264 [Hypothenemus hampei]|uniref:Uncharacterized protein n=1 Tax=Hypothenemus hampei TaxID=57062 RepID=A0ABD1F544_HYPHA
MKLKNRKRSSPNIRLQRPSISSSSNSTNKEIDERLLMPSSEDIHSKSTDESRTSDEEYVPPSMSSECLSKRLSLEDWRPMKGALNSALEDSSSATVNTRKIMNETGNFFNSMLDKLKSLKSCPILELRHLKGKKAAEKTFLSLKNTPEVREKLNFIRKMDEEINETINRYKIQREERLSVEFEMCTTISEENLAGKGDTGVFLQMCNFNERLKKYQNSQNNNVVFKESFETRNNEVMEQKEELLLKSGSFIEKNIHAAKEGVMAGFSLTDEEKMKIDQILQDIDSFQMDDALLTNASQTPCIESKEESLVNQETNPWKNCYSVDGKNKTRMGQIDLELEKFNEDHHDGDDVNKQIPLVKNEEFWKQYVLDQSLKDIDTKLETLYESYREDEERLIAFRRKIDLETNDSQSEEKKDLM